MSEFVINELGRLEFTGYVSGRFLINGAEWLMLKEVDVLFNKTIGDLDFKGLFTYEVITQRIEEK